MSQLTSDHRPALRTGIRHWLGLGLIVVVSGMLGASSLDRGHNWGDDFAAYIMQAQSLVDGRTHEFVLRNTFTISRSSVQIGLISYPWGFPMLLAPVRAVVGTNILALKLVATLCYMLFLVAMFGLARPRLSSSESLLLTAFMAFNPVLLRAQNEILSDLPFLMWSTISLLLVQRFAGLDSSSRPPALSSIGIGLAIFMAAFTRINGVLLLLPLAVAQLSRLRRQASSAAALTAAAVPYVTFAGFYVLQAALLPGSSGGFEAAFASYSWAGIQSSVKYYALLPGDFLQSSAIGGYSLYALLLLFFALTAVRLRTQDIPLLVYFLATVALYVATPFTAGARYIFPILPVFFLFSLEGMTFAVTQLPLHHRRLGGMAIWGLWAGLVIASLLISLRGAWQNLLLDRQASEGPYTAAASPLFSFVRHATPADSVIVFFKPRLMRLLTDRDSFLATECEALSMADYVALAKDEFVYNQIPLSRIGACARDISLTKVFGKGSFVVFRIDPQP